MRILIAVLVFLVSVNAFSQTRKKAQPRNARPAAKQPVESTDNDLLRLDEPSPQPRRQETLPPISSFPLHSTFYHVPHGRTVVTGTFAAEFGSYTVETPNFPAPFTSFDEKETDSFRVGLDAAYGVLPNLSLGLELEWTTASVQNTAYGNTGGSVLPLEPDIKSSGLSDPEITAEYRLLDSDFVLDLEGALRLAFLEAERGTYTDTNADGRGDEATTGNAASGSYGIGAQVQAGYRLSESFNLGAVLAVLHNFAGTITSKGTITDRTTDTEAYTEFAVQAELEYFITPEFALNPVALVRFTPTTKYSSQFSGVTTNFEQAGGKSYSVGIAGSYLLQPQLALRGLYAYTSLESQKLQGGLSGTPLVDVSNTKDRESHSVGVQVAYEF